MRTKLSSVHLIMSLTDTLYTLIKFYGITDWCRFWGTSGEHLVPSLCSGRATYRKMSRTRCRQFLNISEDGESATSLSNLCQHSVALTVKKKKLHHWHWSFLSGQKVKDCEKVSALLCVFYHMQHITLSMVLTRISFWTFNWKNKTRNPKHTCTSC